MNPPQICAGFTSFVYNYFPTVFRVFSDQNLLAVLETLASVRFTRMFLPVVSLRSTLRDALEAAGRSGSTAAACVEHLQPTANPSAAAPRPPDPFPRRCAATSSAFTNARSRR